MPNVDAVILIIGLLALTYIWLPAEHDDRRNK